MGIYFALTFINVILDFGAYIFILVMFNKSGYQYSSIFMIFVNMGFGLSNSIYFLWGGATILKLPKPMRIAFFKSLIGFVGGLTSKIRRSMDKERQPDVPTN